MEENDPSLYCNVQVQLSRGFSPDTKFSHSAFFYTKCCNNHRNSFFSTHYNRGSHLAHITFHQSMDHWYQIPLLLLGFQYQRPGFAKNPVVLCLPQTILFCSFHRPEPNHFPWTERENVSGFDTPFQRVAMKLVRPTSSYMVDWHWGSMLALIPWFAARALCHYLEHTSVGKFHTELIDMC